MKRADLANLTVRMRVAGDKGGSDASVLFDTGASLSFISPELAARIATIVKLSQPVKITLGDGRTAVLTEQALVSIPLATKTIDDNFVLLPGAIADVIVGVTTLRKFQFQIDMGRDAIMAEIKAEAKGDDSMEFIKKLFAIMGIDWKDGVTEEKAAELVAARIEEMKKDKPAPAAAPKKEPDKKDPAAAVPAFVLSALDLKEDAGEAEIKGAIMALKHPGDTVPKGDYEKLKVELHEKDIQETVSSALAAGKLSSAEKDWALEQAKNDLAAFKVFIERRVKVCPVGTKLPEKKDDKTLALIDDVQAAINKQLGVTEDTFKKYNAAAN